MGHSVLEIPRAVRRRLKRLAQKPSEHGRRAHAILLLWETGNCVARVARGLYAARSSVQRWRALFEEYGEQGLRPLERGRSEWKANDKVLESLAALTDSSPRDHGYLRSRWSSELLAIELKRRAGVQVHATTVRRWLKRLGFGYRRARPTLCIRDPNKSQRLEAIATPWPIAAPTVRCSTQMRPTSTSTRESALPGWSGGGRAGFLHRGRTRNAISPAH